MCTSACWQAKVAVANAALALAATGTDEIGRGVSDALVSHARAIDKASAIAAFTGGRPIIRLNAASIAAADSFEPVPVGCDAHTGNTITKYVLLAFWAVVIISTCIAREASCTLTYTVNALAVVATDHVILIYA